MNKRIRFTTMLTFVVVSLFVFASCTNRTKEEGKKEDFSEDVMEVKEEIEEEIKDFKEYTFAERDKFVKSAREELKEINKKIDELKAELAKAGDNVSAVSKAAYQKSIEELEQLRDDYKESIEKLQNSTEKTWEKAKKDVSDRYEKTIDNIGRRWESLVRGINEGVHKVKEELD